MTPTEAYERPGRLLLADRRFLGYLGACFLNAFNDNAFKMIVGLVMLRYVGEEGGGSLLGLTFALFNLPFLIFSSWAGSFADRYPKRTVFVVMHFYEIVAMALAAFAFHTESIPLALAALFWSGAQSAFYSPAKYGLLPESLPHERLSAANGILNAVTFVAIVLGTAFGGFSLPLLDGDPTLASCACAVVATLGLLSSLAVWSPAPARPNARVDWLNPVGDVFRVLVRYLPQARFGAPMIGILLFGFLGQMIQVNVLLHAKQVLYAAYEVSARENAIAILQTVLALGIGIGSIIAARWSGPKVEIGLFPIGVLGTALAFLLLGLFGATPVPAHFALAFLGICSGLFSVPLQATIQSRAPEDQCGAILAAWNFLFFLGTFLAGGVLMGIERAGMTSAHTHFILAAAALVGGVALTLWLGEFLLRFLMWLLTHTIYDIRIRGRENVPERGAALIIANHVSFVDALLIGSCVQRFIRFLMLRDYYDHPAFNWVCRLMKAIPISPGKRDSSAAALDQASAELKKGHVACIFAEGAITRSGVLLPFRKGFEQVARDSGAPIIPVHLDGVWGSIFSFEGGKVLWKWPRQIPYPVTISFGKALPHDATAYEVRQAVTELAAEAMTERVPEHGTLAQGFIRTCRRRWFRPAVVDSSGLALPFGRLLAAASCLGRILPGGNSALGIVLPPTSAGALVNVAATLAGRLPVNINFTASQEAVRSSIERAGITHVVTSAKFTEKVKVDLAPAQVVFIEDLMKSIPKVKILLTEIAYFLLPRPILRRVATRQGRPEDPATIIFSSGSTGLPKGVVLTHANIRANIEGLAQVFDARPDDRVLGALPFFHSFGFTATLWYPLIAGFGAVYHPNPLDPKGIGKMIQKHKATLLVATPTFASSYIRRIPAEEFASIRFTMVGAEKLRPELAKEWQEKYGTPLLEGYGATECAPVVSVNIPTRIKEGSIGHPIPGVAVRIVHPETRAMLGMGAEGMLEVKGANVMKGYLGEPERTAQVLRDGWYTTGDIAMIDRDGYLRITGRLSRFSKIGGEMVPHGRVEEELLSALGTTEPVLVVTGIRDEDGAERLAVLHTVELDPDALAAKLREAGLPNLWIPKKTAFRRVDAIPLLGTGKVDLQGVKAMAEGGNAA